MMVRKMLSILMKKGHVTRKRARRGYVYRAVAPQSETRADMARDLVSRAFGGSASLMLASLLEEKKVGDGEMQRIKALIADYDEEKAGDDG